MAIEALTQVAENRGLRLPGQGYTVQGLRITSALTIPSESSVETMFNLTEQSTFIKGSIKWFDFRISSVTHDGKWSEHGSGMIGLVKPCQDQHHPLPMIRQRKTYRAKTWYEALSKVGVDFGPTFQTLSEIDLVPENSAAIANVSLHTTKQAMTDESRYIIHPASLDGCLQLSIIAAHKTAKSVSKPYLPVYVEDLTVWDLPSWDSNAQDTVAHAKGRSHGLRSVHGELQAFYKGGPRFLNGKIRFLSLEGDLRNSEPKIPREPYSRLIWKPDIDRLGLLSIPFNNEEEPSTALPGVNEFSIIDFIELVSHKGRSLRILQFGSKSLEKIVNILQGRTIRPIYGKYVIISSDDPDSQEMKSICEKFNNMEFRAFSTDMSFEQQFGESETYDIIILASVIGLA